MDHIAWVSTYFLASPHNTLHRDSIAIQEVPLIYSICIDHSTQSSNNQRLML